MSHDQMIRAWKDVEYRRSLSEQERAQIPAHPAGVINLSDSDLERAAGGELPASYDTWCSLGYRCVSKLNSCWPCG